MSAREDVIEVPIEIKTSDLDELQRLVQQLTEMRDQIADTKRVSTARTPASRKMPSGGIGAPIQSDEEPMAIFRQRGEEEVLPTKSRDTTSRQAIHRETPFQDFNKRLENLETNNSNVVGLVAQLANAAGINIPIINNMVRAVGAGKNIVKSSSKLISGVTPVGVAGQVGMVARLSAAAGPIGAIVAGVATVYSMVDWYINNVLLAAGGPLDRRFKRNIKNEIAPEIDRLEKAAISQGFKTVIATSIPNIRGSVGVKSTLESIRRGERLYNADTEFSVKGG